MSENMINVAEMTDETGLIPVGKLNPQRLFIDGYGLDKLLKAIKEQAYAAGQDATTDDGREIIRSTAYKIARSRTFLDKLGQNVVKAEKERVTKANNTRKKIKEVTEKIQADYRKPLTDYEEKEKREEAERKQKEKEKIDERIGMLNAIRCILPYGDIAAMTDDEFTEFYEREKETFIAQAKEAERVKQEAEKLEKEKAEIKKAKRDAIVMRLTQFGMEQAGNQWTFITKYGDSLFVSLEDLVETDMDTLNHKLDELAERIEMAKIYDENMDAEATDEPPDEDEPEQTEDLKADPVEVKTEASGTLTLNDVKIEADMLHSETPLAQTIKELMDADIQMIHSWLDTVQAVIKGRPIFEQPISERVCEDIEDSFTSFIQKTKELVVQELR